MPDPNSSEENARDLSGSGDRRQRPTPVIPDHELLRRIGGGAYGEVWLARNIMGTLRAVKVVYRDSFESERPFEREFEGIRKFEPISRSDECQVDILHVGRSDTYFYYVMELADDASAEFGVRSAESNAASPVPHSALCTPSLYVPHTLRSDLKRLGRLPFERCLEIALSLSTALVHLHKHRLVHRDVKPSNIIFVNGIPKLADIGLVTDTDATRSFVGTDGYVPPEGPGAPQADIFSLGKVLYQISTGLDAKAYPELPTDWGQQPEKEEFQEFNQVVLRACEANVKSRYQTAEQLRADLLLLQSGKSLKRFRMLERHRSLLVKAGVAAVIVAVLAAVGFVYQKRQAQRMARLEHESRERSIRLSVAHGVERMETADLLASQVWFTEALRLGAGNPRDEEIHRFRIEAVRRQCPNLVSFGVHEGQILWAEFSPDGQRIVTAGENGDARVWSVATSDLAFPPLKHEATVSQAVFSPDGNRIATASDDSTARIWNATNGTMICPPLQHASNVVSVAFSPDGKRILTASHDRTARVWDARSGQPLTPPFMHDGRMDMAAFSPDGRLIVTASEDGTACLWDMESGKRVTPPLRHAKYVNHAAFNRDGTRVVTSGNDGTARVWSTLTGEEILRPVYQRDRVHLSWFSPDGERIATVGGMPGVVGEARIWNATNGDLIAPIAAHTRPIIDASVSLNGQWLATASADGTAIVLNATNGDRISPVLRHSHSVTRVCFDPTGKRLLTASRDRTWRVWELAMADLSVPTWNFTNSLWGGEFFPDGKRVLVVQVEHSALVIDSTSTQHPLYLGEFVTFPHRAKLDPSGRYAIGYRHGVRVWDMTSGMEVGSKVLYSNSLQFGPFSPEGARIASAKTNDTARFWHAESGDPLTPHLDPPLLHQFVNFAAFSPDGFRFITGGRRYFSVAVGQAQIWNVTTGKPLGVPFVSPGVVTAGCFSPNGNDALVAVSPDGELPGSAYVLDGRTGKPRGVVLSHADGLHDAQYSPDGQRIVTASEDTTARVWNAITGAPIGRPLKHRRGVIRAIFSPDGRRVATSCSDGTARVWDAQTGDPVSPPLRCPRLVGEVAFSPNGFRLLTVGGLPYKVGPGQARIWELPRTDRPIAELIDEATLLSGLRLDHTGALVPVTPEDLLKLWRTKAKAGISHER